jgi:hypothetical protein
MKYEIIAGMREGRRGLKSAVLPAWFFNYNDVINRF